MLSEKREEPSKLEREKTTNPEGQLAIQGEAMPDVHEENLFQDRFIIGVPAQLPNEEDLTSEQSNQERMFELRQVFLQTQCRSRAQARALDPGLRPQPRIPCP